MANLHIEAGVGAFVCVCVCVWWGRWCEGVVKGLGGNSDTEKKNQVTLKKTRRSLSKLLEGQLAS